MPDIQFIPLGENDIVGLTGPMTRAFENDAKIYDGIEKGGPPGYNDGSFLQKWAIDDPKSIAYKIVLDDISVGAFIIWWVEQGMSILGALFIDPCFHNMQIGRKAWNFIETRYPAKCWRLETPTWATRNHYFYEKVCGFQKTEISHDQQIFVKKREPTIMPTGSFP